MWEEFIGTKILVKELESEYANPFELTVLNVRPVNLGERALIYTGKREGAYWLNPAEYVVVFIYSTMDKKSPWFKYLGKNILVTHKLEPNLMEEYMVLNVRDNFILVHKMHDINSIKCWIDARMISICAEV